jgi:hypothetical protein
MDGRPRRLSRLPGTLWALPPTLLGFALVAYTGRSGQWRDGVFWANASRGLGRLIARPGGPSATTFGCVVLLWKPDRFGPRLQAHELVHVDQYRRLGIVFFPIYLALLPFYGWHERHPLEAPAYRRAKELDNA